MRVLLFILIAFAIVPASGFANITEAKCRALQEELVVRFRAAQVDVISDSKVAELRCVCKDDRCGSPLKLNVAKLRPEQKNRLLQSLKAECLHEDGRDTEAARSTAAVKEDPACMMANRLLAIALGAMQPPPAAKYREAFSKERWNERPEKVVSCQSPDGWVDLLTSCAECPGGRVCKEW